jgi:hypothetical protein
VAVGAAVAYAWWVTSLRPFSGPATAAVVGGGLAAMVLGRQFLPPRPPAGPVAFADLARWGLAVGALVVWQLIAWASEPRSDHPTLSSLANAALDPRPVRAVAVVAWLVGAAWLGRR